MSKVHGNTNNKEVESFAEDKSKVIDVVLVMNIVLEELKTKNVILFECKLISFLKGAMSYYFNIAMKMAI